MLEGMWSHSSSPVLIGRGDELNLLLDTAADAAAGTARAVLVAGEAGVGKSRLLDEFGRRAATERVLTGNCLELGVDGLPFAPFVTALRQLVRELGAEHLSRVFGGPPDELARLLPELGAAAAEREDSRGHLFDQVLRLLESAAEPGGLSLVIEDAHWADRSTRDLFVFLVHNLGAARVQLVLSYRSDELHRAHPLRRLLPQLRRLDHVAAVELSGLSRGEVAELAAAIRGAEPPPALLDTIHERSNGNPLFVESLLECGAHGLGRVVPDTLRDLLLGAIQRLPDDAARVVAAASVAGERVDHELLRRVTGLPEAALDGSLRAAVDGNVLRVEPSRHGDPAGYVFRHALLREAVHDDLLPGEHTRLHARYADELEADPSLLPARDRAVALAHHRHSANQLPQALSAAWLAAGQAYSALAFAEKLQMLERILELWDRVPDAAALIGADRLDVLRQAVGAALSGGDPERAGALATAALRGLDPAEDPVRYALLLRQRGRARRELGQAESVDDLRAALATLPADRPERALLLATLANDLMLHPRLAESIELADEALALARATGHHYVEADALITRGVLHVQRGAFDTGMRLIDEGEAIARRISAITLEQRAISNRAAMLSENAGRLHEALRVAESGYEQTTRLKLQRLDSVCTAINIVEIRLLLGQYDRCRTAVEETLRWQPARATQLQLRLFRGRAALLQGDTAAARADLDAYLAAPGRRDTYSQEEGPAAVLEIGVLLAEGRPGEAVGAALAALGDGTALRCDIYGWQLLGATAVLLTDPRAAAEAGPERMAALAAAVRAAVAEMNDIYPAQQAHRAAVGQLLREYEGAASAAAAWSAVAERWAGLEQPYERAEALLRAAEAAAEAGERAAAGRLVRAAAEAAAPLPAPPLRARVQALAARIGEPLDTAAPVPSAPGLTPRETEVLRLLARGRSNREIAGELFISAKTASVHVSNILGKLGVPNRGAAAAEAFRLGLVAPERV
ncbi:helix-turn-helix transcriptional regulator [Allonocardiopsis opalescens]|uniref:Regulatory LuxR family protein n=1 Tax=Allonocardiopsis opalescens TaxID=1144618 RepID=A0A2T0PZZ0_9ACTN|nr:helix-turn-helix transcriptional regulator [Allonocardiopsis opalescens]PRX97119.1 regulatory LuxR family protein [Allonocardiopsis opalescens]